MQILIVGLSGFLGAITRYLISQAKLHVAFPVNTLVINTLGCFFAGLLASLTVRIFPEHKQLLTLISLGFIGSFTTFSTFSMETLELLGSNSIGLALVNLFLSVFLGLLASWVGLKVFII